MAAVEEKRGRWEFTIPENGLWEWRVVHPDGRTACGDSGHRTLKDCVDDAKKYGYVYGLRRGAVMRDVASGKARAHKAASAEMRADALGMYELVKKLASSNPADARLMQTLCDEAKRLLAP